MPPLLAGQHDRHATRIQQPIQPPQIVQVARQFHVALAVRPNVLHVAVGRARQFAYAQVLGRDALEAMALPCGRVERRMQVNRLVLELVGVVALRGQQIARQHLVVVGQQVEADDLIMFEQIQQERPSIRAVPMQKAVLVVPRHRDGEARDRQIMEVVAEAAPKFQIDDHPIRSHGARPFVRLPASSPHATTWRMASVVWQRRDPLAKVAELHRRRSRRLLGDRRCDVRASDLTRPVQFQREALRALRAARPATPPECSCRLRPCRSPS